MAFVDVTDDVGLQFQHQNGMSGRRFIAEVMGAGVALLDFDRDGDLDLFLVQGGALEVTEDGGWLPPSTDGVPGGRLLRNELAEDGSLHFVEVTSEANLSGARGYGMGAFATDVDSNGWVDLYLTNFGRNQLWLNQGSNLNEAPTFRLASSGPLEDPRWSTAAVFLDFDRDGLEDLFVGNYIDFSPANHRTCFAEGGSEDYCGPMSYSPQPDSLLRNRGLSADGSVQFEDVTLTAGFGAEFGSTLGAVALDVNRDGWLDLFVANDATPNHLWINQRDGTFQQEGMIRGVSLNGTGGVEGSMGVVAADLDGDLDEDIFVTHLVGESNTLYQSNGDGLFADATIRFGLAAPSLPFTSFGVAALDHDNDGWLELFVANGSVKEDRNLTAAGDPYPLHQRNQFFGGVEGGAYREDKWMPRSDVSRGVAAGDLDNDGDTDLVVTNNNGRARVLLNESAEHTWLGFELVSRSGRSHPAGARLILTTRSGRKLLRVVRRDGSYLSSNDPRVLFGLGQDAAAGLEVVWPSGVVEYWPLDAANQYVTVHEGTGKHDRSE